MYKLHAIIVDKSIPLPKAKKIGKEIMNKPTGFIRETSTSHRIRAIPKEKFVKSSFRSKPINKDVTLVFGKLKSKI